MKVRFNHVSGLAACRPHLNYNTSTLNDLLIREICLFISYKKQKKSVKYRRIIQNFTKIFERINLKIYLLMQYIEQQRIA